MKVVSDHKAQLLSVEFINVFKLLILLPDLVLGLSFKFLHVTWRRAGILR